MRIPHATGRGAGRSLQLSAERLVNLYAEQAPQGAKSPVVVHGCPGLTRFAEINDERPRGLYRTPRDGRLYLVAAQTLYFIDSDGTYTSLGTIAGAGRVGMADNGTQLCIVTGSKGYIYDTENGLQLIPDFPGAEDVTFMDGFFVFAREGTGQDDEQFFISALRDGLSLDALDFASAESYPDGLVRSFADHSELLLFGTDTIEIWFNAGAADFPFRRAQGSVIEQGIGAKWSVAKCDETVFWLDNEGSVRRLQGNTPVRVSTHSIENAIAKGDWENASAWSYVEEGHAFYVLTVPARTLQQTAGTYVFDAATGLWHERKSHERDYCRSGFYARAYGKHITCDHDRARLYEQSLDVYTENGEHLIAEMIFPPLQSDGERFIVDSLQLDLEVGVGGRKRSLPPRETNVIAVWSYYVNIGLRTFEFDGDTFTQVGNTLDVSLGGFATSGDATTLRDDFVPLTERTIATVNNKNDRIQAYRWDGTDWTADGSHLSYAATNGQSVAAMSSSRVAVMNTGPNEMFVAEFDGSGWTRVGNALDFPNGIDTLGQVVALSPTRVVINRIIQGGTSQNRGASVYDWDGSDWQLVGNPYPVSSTEGFYITALTAERVAIIGHENTRYLRTLVFDGSDWVEEGNSLSLSLLSFTPSVPTAMTESRITAYNNQDDSLYVFDYNGSDWAQVGSPTVMGLTGAGLGIAALGAYDDVGLGIDSSDPQIMLRESRDGRTWGMSEDWRSVGKQGEYDTRVIWRRRGQYRSYTPRISISTPVKRAIFAAYAKIRPTR